MKNRLMELLKIKSIVTIGTLIVFCILSIRRDIDADQFLTIFSVIIAFYFGTKHEQNNKRM